MRILYLIPPRCRNRWVIREHKEGAFDFPHLPLLGASVLGLVQKDHPGISIEVLDAQLEDLDYVGVSSRVVSLSPDLIVTQLGSYTMKHDRPYAEFGYPTICISPESFDPLEIIRLYDVKSAYFTISEIEKTVSEGIEEFMQKGRIEHTAGYVIREGEETRSTGTRPFVPLTDLPMPAYDLFCPEHYFKLQEKETGSRCAFISTARGCPFSCRFCTSWAEKPVRFKSISQAIDEMNYFRHNFACMSFNFCDSTFSTDKSRTIELCERIHYHFPDIHYIVNDSVNTVDNAILDAYASSGCSLIRFGIESGDQDILERVSKPISSSKAISVFRGARDRGIATDAFIMVGFPGETKDSLNKTQRLISELEPDRFTVSMLFPKPFSTFHKELSISGDLIEKDWSTYLDPKGLMFKHDTYASIAEIIRAKNRLTGRIARDLARKKFARSNKDFKDKFELALGYIKTLGFLKKPALALCEHSNIARRIIYRFTDYDRMYTHARKPQPSVLDSRKHSMITEQLNHNAQKTALFIMPSLPAKTPYPWYLREERHSGGETGFFLAPVMVASVIAKIRQDLPNVRIIFRDLQLDPLSKDGIQTLAEQVNPDIIVAVTSANLLHTESERIVLDLPFPTLCILSPVQADPEEAVRHYGLTCRYFSHTDEVERTVSSALREFFATGDITTTPGMYIQNDGKGFMTDEAVPQDMTDLPLPSYDVIQLHRYLKEQSALNLARTVLVNTMKGCPFSCTFCCVGSERYPGRYRQATAMFEEVKLLHDSYGITMFNFLNSEFSPDRKTAKEFCKMVIKSGINIGYTIKERIECVDTELLSLLKVSGCTAVYYGIETADPRVQKRIRKRIDLDRAVEVIRQTKTVGIHAVVYMMLGLPGEDEKTSKANMDFVLKARPDGTVWSTLFPEHGSPLLEELNKDGHLRAENWSEFRSQTRLGYPHEYYRSRAQVERAKFKLQFTYRLALACRGDLSITDRVKSLIMAALTLIYLEAALPLTLRSETISCLVERMKISFSRKTGPIL